MLRGFRFSWGWVFWVVCVCLFWWGTQVHAGQGLGSINLSEVAPRVLTPNGDGKNDTSFFKFDQSLAGLPISGEVFDITGSRVASLSVFTDDKMMFWNGKDEDGMTVRSGIYIYQIKLGADKTSGTIVVMR